MNRNPANAPQRGFTLIEVMIAVVILAGISYVTLTLTGSAGKLLRSRSLIAQGQRQAMDLAKMLEFRLRNGGLSTLRDGAGNAFADGATTTNGIRMQLCTGFVGGPVYGETVGFLVNPLEVNPTDGVDNNRDNLIDEVDLLFRTWPGAAAGPPATQITAGTRIRGLKIARTGKRLDFRVTTQYYDPVDRQLRTFTGSSTLLVRNP